MSSENFYWYTSSSYILPIGQRRCLRSALGAADAFPDFLNIIINEHANFFKSRNFDLTRWISTGIIWRRKNLIEFALIAFALAQKQTD